MGSEVLLSLASEESEAMEALIQQRLAGLCADCALDRVRFVRSAQLNAQVFTAHRFLVAAQNASNDIVVQVLRRYWFKVPMDAPHSPRVTHAPALPLAHLPFRAALGSAQQLRRLCTARRRCVSVRRAPLGYGSSCGL